VPLPAAGRFSGIRWETAQADLTPGEVERVLQANARCQWLRAAAASREAATADAVLAEAAGWPAFRDEGPVAESALLLECVASHAREVAYARRLGLPPSS
jgi:hypothetical protein